jgi:hypothetical protein
MRRIALLLLLLAAPIGCAPAFPPGLDATSVQAARAYAARLDQADEAAGAALARLDAAERHMAEEAAAIGFATRRATRGRADEAGRVEAASRVLGAGFDALDLEAGHLAALAAGAAPSLPPGVEAAALEREAAAGLAALDPASAPARETLLAALRTLAAPPPAGADLRTVALQRQPEVETVAATMRAVLGENEAAGLRGALAARLREASSRRAALMEAARRDGSLGVMGRYELYWQTQEAERALAAGEDPALAALHEVLERLPAAHAAVAEADPAAAAERLRAFGEAVERLWWALRDDDPAD